MLGKFKCVCGVSFMQDTVSKAYVQCPSCGNFNVELDVEDLLNKFTQGMKSKQKEKIEVSSNKKIIGFQV